MIIKLIFSIKLYFKNNALKPGLICLMKTCLRIFVMFDLFNFMKNVRLDSLDQIAVGSVPFLILENNATKCVLAKKGIVTFWMDAKKRHVNFYWLMHYMVEDQHKG